MRVPACGWRRHCRPAVTLFCCHAPTTATWLPSVVVVLRCRWFPEGARCAALQGAEVRSAGVDVLALRAATAVTWPHVGLTPGLLSYLTPWFAASPAVAPADPVLPHCHWQRASQPILQLLSALGARDAGPCGRQHGASLGGAPIDWLAQLPIDWLAQLQTVVGLLLHPTWSAAASVLQHADGIATGWQALAQLRRGSFTPQKCKIMLQVPVVASNRIGTEAFEHSHITFYGGCRCLPSCTPCAGPVAAWFTACRCCWCASQPVLLVHFTACAARIHRPLHIMLPPWLPGRPCAGGSFIAGTSGEIVAQVRLHCTVSCNCRAAVLNWGVWTEVGLASLPPCQLFPKMFASRPLCRRRRAQQAGQQRHRPPSCG